MYYNDFKGSLGDEKRSRRSISINLELSPIRKLANNRSIPERIAFVDFWKWRKYRQRQWSRGSENSICNTTNPMLQQSDKGAEHDAKRAKDLAHATYESIENRR